MILLILIPFLCFLCLFLLTYKLDSPAGILTSIRTSFMYATMGLGTFITVVTEVLSPLKLVNFPGLLICWLMMLSALVICCRKKGIRISLLQEMRRSAALFFKQNKSAFIIVVALLISLFEALVYPPNNYDSMTYHMARVGHWIMNQSVADYSTHILRQLVFPPLSEFIIMHIQILSGGDRFANAIQTFFFGGCILQASLIVKVLGGNTVKQLLSALFVCLIPMALLESNTTQNDIVAGYFILAFIYFVIKIFRKDTIRDIVLAGVAFGLAILTKGTAYLFMVFLGWLVFVLLKYINRPVKEIMFRASRLALIPLIGLLFSGLHFYRNYELNGSILGKGNEGVANEAHEIKPLMLVVVKNLMNHYPVTYEDKHALAAFSDRHGLDVNDPKYNFQTLDQMVTGFKYHEDYVQNFFHTIYIILFGFIFLARKKLYNNPPDLFVLFVLTSYVIAAAFCFLFKWQPWGNRLETSLFFVFSIVVGMLAGDLPKWMRWLFLLPLIYTGGLSLLYNGNHPILPWKENIFVNGYDEFIFNKDEYREEKIFFDTTSIRKFGLHLGPDTWDYPYYKLLSESKIRKGFTLKPIYVTNESKKYSDGYVPEAYLSYDIGRVSDTLGGKKFYKTRVFGKRMALFEVRD